MGSKVGIEPDYGNGIKLGPGERDDNQYGHGTDGGEEVDAEPAAFDESEVSSEEAASEEDSEKQAEEDSNAQADHTTAEMELLQ